MENTSHVSWELDLLRRPVTELRALFCHCAFRASSVVPVAGWDRSSCHVVANLVCLLSWKSSRLLVPFLVSRICVVRTAAVRLPCIPLAVLLFIHREPCERFLTQRHAWNLYHGGS